MKMILLQFGGSLGVLVTPRLQFLQVSLLCRSEVDLEVRSGEFGP